MKSRILLASAFFIWTFLLINCSEKTDEELKDLPPYIPFPVTPAEPLSSKDLKLIDFEKFVRIEPGEFLMGSPQNETGRSVTKTMIESGAKDNEALHKVKITRVFFMSKFETTLGEWNQRYGDALRKEVFFSMPQDGFEISKWIIDTKKNKSEPFKKILSELMNESKDLVNLFNKLEKFLSSEEESFFINTQELGSFIGLLSETRSNKLDIGDLSQGEVQNTIKKLNTLLREKRNLPVTDISYSQAVSFCSHKTNWAHQNGLLPNGFIYRLPTEAEWEYACRAGNSGVAGLDDGENLSGMIANINGGNPGNLIGRKDYLINRKKLIPIDRDSPKFAANAWGLHDMHGNVMEWCYDYYGYYSNDQVSLDPIGPIRGTKRVLRGGSFLRPAQNARSAARESLEPSWRGSEIGFRVVLGYPLR